MGGRGGIPGHHGDHGAGQERAEDAFQAESLGQRGERDQQHHGEPDPDLGGAVLQPDQQVAESAGPAGGSDRDTGGGDDRGEGDQEDDLGAGGATGGREEQRQQHDGGEVGHAGGRDGALADRAVHDAGVFEDRNDQAQRGGGQGDGQQQRLADPAGRVERDAGGAAQYQGDQVARAGQHEHATAQPPGVDLQPGQEQQEGQPEQRQDLHREIDVQPAEHGRAERDSGDDLEDHRRDAQPGQEPDQQGRGDGDRADDEQVGE